MSFSSWLRSLMNNTRAIRGRTAGTRRKPVRHRLMLEVLEDRVVPTGLAVDTGASRLLIFDSANGAQTGLVNLPTSSFSALDTVISPDGKRAYVSDFNNQRVLSVDLATQAVNPIPVPTHAEDLAITPDGKFLLASDGSGGSSPIAVINTATNAVQSFSTGADNTCIEVTKNGDVLVGVGLNRIERYTLSTTAKRIAH